MEYLIELKPIKLDDNYRKKWNIYLSDFVQLYLNGVKLRNTLYRIGGFGTRPNDVYFILLKYNESQHPSHITKDKDKKNHLRHEWCILNQNGIEKVCINEYKSVYVYGQIYSVDSSYYNIESGKFYARSNSLINSDGCIFLSNKFDKNLEKRGMMVINKTNGTYKIYP